MIQTDTYGWAGTVLLVNLTDKEIRKVPTQNYAPEKFIGGVGLCSKIYWDMGCPGKEAFDPKNPVMVAVGPMTGIPGPFNRGEICGIGAQNYPKPQFTYSGFGGSFPAAMKYAGYDAIVITGKADKPVYLDIRNDAVEIRDAADLWGLDLFEVQETLMSRAPRASVLAIGPAGENLSPTAIVANETTSSAGQGGFGAVMGSKNLKAISAKGTKVVKIARPEELRKVVKSCHQDGKWLTGASQPFCREPLCGGEAADELVSKYRTGLTGPYGCPYQCIGFYDMPGVGKGGGMCASWWYGFYRAD
ncbi:MAG: hypothetical protein JRH15_09005, partial [Deltaproteobacteria bacterium]|nr:hypothetical protein [Deltaproteobacteria bacterium]